jgi:hypothetical protein
MLVVSSLAAPAAAQTESPVMRTESPVVMTRTLEDRLADPANRITLAHNHPDSSSLSCTDLALLRKPGLARIAANGHDGSVFEASAGPRFDRQTSIEETCPTVVSRILFRFDLEHSWSSQDMTDALPFVAHLAALALDRTGVIVYRAALSPEAAAIARRFDGAFERTVEAVAKQIEQDLARR